MTDLIEQSPHASRPGVIHAALAMGGFAIGTTEFATMSLLPSFARGLGVDPPTAGHVISAYALGVVVGAPLLAVLGTRLSRRTLLLVLMLWFAAGNALSALAPTYDTLLAIRFLTGVPHGTYFGIAALVAVGVAPPERRAAAVGRVMTGLTVATIVGVPLANLLGQWLGWRWGFGFVALIALATAALVLRLVPYDRPRHHASPLRELSALWRGQVWLTLAIGAIGFGGLFAVYTYLAFTLHAVTHASATAVPFVLAMFGVGLTAGNLVVPRFADRSLMPTAAGLLVWSAAACAGYVFAAGALWSVTLAVTAVGIGGALATVLQTRLMDVAGEAQGLAAALNHSAFNTANALGPWLGGMAIAGGYGWTASGWVGCGLAVGGLALCLIAIGAERLGVRRPRLAGTKV